MNTKNKLEKDFEKEVCSEIIKEFPGAVILKLDPLYIQGIPDRLVLYEKNWAALEIKRFQDSSKRPNQEYYINLLSKMSYASFLNLDNKELVYAHLQRIFRST